MDSFVCPTCRLKELEEQYAREKAESEMLFEKQRKVNISVLISLTPVLCFSDNFNLPSAGI